ncbi:MAG: lipoate--protein ligase family protein, partial [Treponema sp.]|nr:lipoate--protein ligase family protein [Treponema sp.]
WKPPAVSIGYFQGLEEEVDLEACARYGVDVVRRISGGGAVFHDQEITYSLIMPVSHALAGNSILESYRTLCSGIVSALSRLGLAAEFVPINDILARGRKVSGNAQTRRQGCVLQHGTVLLDLNPELMFELLRVPEEKMKGKLIKDVRARVSPLPPLLGRSVSFDEGINVLAEGFKEQLHLDFVSLETAPSYGEEERALALGRDKFGSREWLQRR